MEGTENVSRDLETFAKHAGRSTVTTDDVLLLCRRNAALETMIRAFVDVERAQCLDKEKKGVKRR